MRRTLFVLLILALVIAMTGVAAAATYSGGTDQQHASAQAIIASCWWDWEATDAVFGGVEVVFEEHHGPYWEGFRNEVDPVVAGLAYPGHISVSLRYQPGPDSWFGEIVSHEWAHQIWFTLGREWRQKWTNLCTEGVESYDIYDWMTSPHENFAECMRVALWPEDVYFNDYPRTLLKRISLAECRTFLLLWKWGRTVPFTDLAKEDDELKAASGYLHAQRIMSGYPDGTLGPYQPLLRRHVALIADRMGLVCSLSVDDYSPALRADVRDGISGLTWLEERWDESITRGQLARLIWRAHLPTMEERMWETD